jgi:glycosyltransferase involved in cell wall biosynthesis
LYALRICLLYDRLFPLTLGGAERWYRDLAERLAAAGHDVTYVTLRHWDRSVTAEIPGVDVVVLGPEMGDAYDSGIGRRRIGPPMLYGALVFLWLLRHGRRFDAVHSMAFPYFSVLAAGTLRRLSRYTLVVDWFEVWTRTYWREYVGRIAGDIGYAVQRVCVRLTQRAFCFSRVHAARLPEEGFKGELVMLAGLYGGAERAAHDVHETRPIVVYAGRHIPEKRVPALVRAMPLVLEQAPELRCQIYGDGPQEPEVRQLAQELGLDGTVTLAGFVSAAEVHDGMAHATCLVLPSSREGYGLVVVEAAALGTPVVVVDGPDNAAVELVEDGVNGFVAASASPEDLADAIVRVRDAGPDLRASTAAWFESNNDRLRIDNSIAAVVASYGTRDASARS